MKPPIATGDALKYRERAMALGKALCDACGLDPQVVRNITLNVPAGELVTVDVEIVVHNPEALLPALQALKELEPLDSVSIAYKPEEDV